MEPTENSKKSEPQMGFEPIHIILTFAHSGGCLAGCISDMLKGDAVMSYAVSR